MINWFLFGIFVQKNIMWSNLQKMIGIQAGIIPTTLQPNEYMDNLLENAKITMKERGLDNIDLPEQTQGITLYDGRMTGLGTVHKWRHQFIFLHFTPPSLVFW